MPTFDVWDYRVAMRHQDAQVLWAIQVSALFYVDQCISR